MLSTLILAVSLFTASPNTPPPAPCPYQITHIIYFPDTNKSIYFGSEEDLDTYLKTHDISKKTWLLLEGKLCAVESNVVKAERSF